MSNPKTTTAPIFTNALGVAVEIDIALKQKSPTLTGLDNLHYTVDGIQATMDFCGIKYQIEIKPIK
jgi:hypothetical protein